MPGFQITIIGLGLTGTSLGLALKAAARELYIVGHDKEPEAASAAHKAGAVDRTEWNLPSSVRNARLVILALPLSQVRDTLAFLGADLQPGCLLTATVPLMRPVLRWAAELLPAETDFVAANPLIARGLTHQPSADLFNGATCCLCPAPAATEVALQRAVDLAQAIGATARFVDPAEHDGLAAAIDQLPFLLAAAALQTAQDSTAWRELAVLGGGRLDALLAHLGNNPAAALETAAANAENAGRWLLAMEETLARLRQVLTAEPQERTGVIERLEAARQEWERRGQQPPPQPQVGLSLKRLFWFNRPER